MKDPSWKTLADFTLAYTNAQPGQEAFGIMNMHGGRFAIFVGGFPIEVDGEVDGPFSKLSFS